MDGNVAQLELELEMRELRPDWANAISDAHFVAELELIGLPWPKESHALLEGTRARRVFMICM